MADQLTQDLLRDHNDLVRDRAPFEREWQDLAVRLIPTQQFWQTGQTPQPSSSPDVYDGTPRGALFRFSAAINGLVSPPGQKWHGLAPENVSDPSEELLKYLERKRDLLFKLRYRSKSGYARSNLEVFASMGAFGTGCLMVNADMVDGPSYEAIPLRQLYIGTSAMGRPDRVYRVCEWKGYQAEQFFQGKLPPKLAAVVERDKNATQRYLHCVKPNDQREYGRKDYRGMAYGAWWLWLDGEEMIESAGFRTMPYAIARYTTVAGEAYGRGPGHAVHPAIQMANTIKRGAIVYGNRAAEPPLGSANEDIRVDIGPNKLNPGTISADGHQLVQPIAVTGAFDVPEKMLEEERTTIRDAFLDTLWQILVEKPTATATEVLERASEKGILLSPVTALLEGDYFDVEVERDLDIMASMGAFVDSPPDLALTGGKLNAIYDSPLTRAQRAGDGAAVLRWLQGMAAVAQFDPTSRFLINGEENGRTLAKSFGVPAACLHTSNEIKAMQDKELEQQQLQTMIQAAPAASAAAANLSKLGSAGQAPV